MDPIWVAVNAINTGTTYISTTPTIWLTTNVTGTSSTYYAPLTANSTMMGTASYYEQQAMQMMLAQAAICQAQAQVNRYVQQAPPPPSAAEIEARRQNAADYRRREDERAEHRRRAEDRARDLLLSHLTDEQCRTMREHGWFIVEGGKSKRRYQISTTHAAGNIHRLDDDGMPDERLCGHHRGVEAIPLHDQLLAQKLMLEADEDRYRHLANRSRLR